MKCANTVKMSLNIKIMGQTFWSYFDRTLQIDRLSALHLMDSMPLLRMRLSFNKATFKLGAALTVPFPSLFPTCFASCVERLS